MATAGATSRVVREEGGDAAWEERGDAAAFHDWASETTLETADLRRNGSAGDLASPMPRLDASGVVTMMQIQSPLHRLDASDEVTAMQMAMPTPATEAAPDLWEAECPALR